MRILFFIGLFSGMLAQADTSRGGPQQPVKRTPVYAPAAPVATSCRDAHTFEWNDTFTRLRTRWAVVVAQCQRQPGGNTFWNSYSAFQNRFRSTYLSVENSMGNQLCRRTSPNGISSRYSQADYERMKSGTAELGVNSYSDYAAVGTYSELTTQLNCETNDEVTRMGVTAFCQKYAGEFQTAMALQNTNDLNSYIDRCTPACGGQSCAGGSTTTTAAAKQPVQSTPLAPPARVGSNRGGGGGTMAAAHTGVPSAEQRPVQAASANTSRGTVSVSVRPRNTAETRTATTAKPDAKPSPKTNVAAARPAGADDTSDAGSSTEGADGAPAQRPARPQVAAAVPAPAPAPAAAPKPQPDSPTPVVAPAADPKLASTAHPRPLLPNAPCDGKGNEINFAGNYFYRTQQFKNYVTHCAALMNHDDDVDAWNRSKIAMLKTFNTAVSQMNQDVVANQMKSNGMRTLREITETVDNAQTKKYLEPGADKKKRCTEDRQALLDLIKAQDQSVSAQNLNPLRAYVCGGH